VRSLATDGVATTGKNVTSRRPSAGAFLQMWGEAIAADPVPMPLYAEDDASFRRMLADKVREGICDVGTLALHPFGPAFGG
jgi:hypothetical protein